MFGLSCRSYLKFKADIKKKTVRIQNNLAGEAFIQPEGGERIISRIFIAVPQLEIIFPTNKHTHTRIVNAICVVAGGRVFSSDCE